jgi:alpha-tubulin suppressor-like RCC1 family protein
MPPNPVDFDIYMDFDIYFVLALSKGSTSTHSCAVLVDGSVRCWGDNNAGKLGYGHTLDIGDNPQEMPSEAVLAY